MWAFSSSDLQKFLEYCWQTKVFPHYVTSCVSSDDWIEWSSYHITDKNVTSPTVCPHVCLQITRLGEILITLVTSIILLLIVCHHVLLQGTRKSKIWSYCNVCPYVWPQGSGLSETLITLLTSIWPLPTVCHHVCFQGTKNFGVGWRFGVLLPFFLGFR